MKRYNSCDVNNMNFREIIEELFSFKKISPNKNPFDVKKLVMTDFEESAWTENETMTFELDIIYECYGNKNIIHMINPTTGELYLIVEQTPNMLPTSENRWNYEIVFSSWDFNHSFKISCGFAILMGEV